jgi:ribose-phosphate pyrophosphokinase
MARAATRAGAKRAFSPNASAAATIGGAARRAAPMHCHRFSRFSSSASAASAPMNSSASTTFMGGAVLSALAALGLGAATSFSASATPASIQHDEAGVPASFKTAKLFTGNANPQLAQEIAEEIGIQLGKATVGRFSDGEVNVMIHENVRGQDIYIVQPTCPPTNENLMELLLLISSMRRASARRITAVIPYYGYARQDRKMTSRVPISAADVARLLEAMGVDRVIAVDLHCGQIQGFFGPRVPVDNLAGGPVGVEYFAKNVKLDNPVVVSPDAGGVYRAKKFRDRLDFNYDIDASVAMIIKQRRKAGVIAQMDLVGSVQDADVIIVDDMIDSAGTLCKAAAQIKKFGAKRVFAFASHGIFSGPANERIANSELEQVVVVNSIPLSTALAKNPKITQLSIAPLLSKAIMAVQSRKSVSSLFANEKQNKN